MALKLHIMPLNPFLFFDEISSYINLKSVIGYPDAFQEYQEFSTRIQYSSYIQFISLGKPIFYNSKRINKDIYLYSTQRIYLFRQAIEPVFMRFLKERYGQFW